MFFRSQKYSGCHAPQDASINTRKGWSVWRWTNERDTDIFWASTGKDFYFSPFCDAHLIDQGQKRELVLQFFAWPLRPHCYLIISGVFPDGWSGKRTVLRNVEPFRRKRGHILSCICIIQQLLRKIIAVTNLIFSFWVNAQASLWQKGKLVFYGLLEQAFKSCFLCILTLLLPGCILVDTQSNFA